MPSVSRRGEQMIHSPIRSLMPFARQAKKDGAHVYHLNIGQPDIKTPIDAIRSLQNYDQSIIKYGASEGSVELRETVAKYYQSEVSNVNASNIYVTTGASEAILFILFSCFEAGEEIIIPEPFYANYIGFSQVSGVVLRPVQSQIENGFDLPKPESFEAQITAQTKAIFLCNPGNPTGNLYSKEALIEIGELVLKHDLFLIVDEVYREFCYDQSFFSVLNLEGLEEHVVVVDSISKVFSACGSRVGYVVTRSQAILDNILKYAQLRLCPPMIGQHVAQACYSNRKEYLDQVREEYNTRRLYLYDRLSKVEGVTCYLPKAAFYIMTALPVQDNLSNHIGKDQVRIAFVLGVEALERAIDILEKGLIEYQNKIPSDIITRDLSTSIV